MKRRVVGSSTVSGLNVTQISEPSLRMVGISVSQLVSETVCASSTQQKSTPSVDLMLCSFRSRPLKTNRAPVTSLRISESTKVNCCATPRRSAVSRSN